MALVVAWRPASAATRKGLNSRRLQAKRGRSSIDVRRRFGACSTGSQSLKGSPMLRTIAFSLATTALAACATQGPPVPPPPAAALAPQAVEAQSPSAPKPQYGTYGFDAAGMDRSVAPGDNFYQFANGTWAKTTPIPADKAAYGAFNFLDDLSHTRTQEILGRAK